MADILMHFCTGDSWHYKKKTRIENLTLTQGQKNLIFFPAPDLKTAIIGNSLHHYKPKNPGCKNGQS